MGYFSQVDNALRADGIMTPALRRRNRAQRSTVIRMAGWDAAQIRQAMVTAREQGQTGVEYVPDTLNVVGGASDQVLRRKATCRACGVDMPQGATATQFAYRFYPDVHPYRITEAFMHPERCH